MQTHSTVAANQIAGIRRASDQARIRAAVMPAVGGIPHGPQREQRVMSVARFEFGMVILGCAFPWEFGLNQMAAAPSVTPDTACGVEKLMWALAIFFAAPKHGK